MTTDRYSGQRMTTQTTPHIDLPAYADIKNETVTLRRTADGYETPDGRYKFIRNTYAGYRNGCWRECWDVRVADPKQPLGYTYLCRSEDRLKDCKYDVFYDLVSDLPDEQQDAIDNLVAA